MQRRAGAGDVGVDVAVEERDAEDAGDAARPMEVVGRVAAHVSGEVERDARGQSRALRGVGEGCLLLACGDFLQLGAVGAGSGER